MDINGLTAEQKARAKTCASAEELMRLAEEEGLELSDEQLEQVSGGWGSGGCSDVCNVYDDLHAVNPTQDKPHRPHTHH